MSTDTTPPSPSPTAVAAAKALADLIVRVTGEQINAAVRERLEVQDRKHQEPQ